MELLNWKNDKNQSNRIPAIDWTALQEYAAELKNKPVRILEFDDGIKWVARIQLHVCTEDSKKRLIHEVHTLSILRERTKIPVPEVLGYESSGEIIGRAFMIMEFILGSTAMDAFGGWRTHKGEIPQQFKPAFYRNIADVQVAMSTIRFPKIGRIVRLDGGSYDVDAIPGLGGPFETATEYFAAWGQAAKFPAGEAYIRSCLPLHVQDEFVVSIREFPHRIAKGGYQITVKNEGPFPLYHPDFRHSNVIIDKNYNILSIIDWENAGTVPWEIIEFPLFLGTLPPPMDLETNYDTEGNPTNEEMQQIWKDRTDYVRDVMHFECRNLSDRSLSTMLASRYTQNIGTAIRLYHESGKLGPYCNVLDKP